MERLHVTTHAARGGSPARRRTWHIVLLIPALAAASAAGLAPRATTAGAQRAIGDTRVWAPVPYPGQPTGIVVDADTVYVGTGVAFDQPVDDWRIFAYDRQTGRQKTNETITIPRATPISLMGLGNLAVDAQGRIYAVDMNGGILRSTVDKKKWEVYANLPTHGIWPASTMPIDLAFDRNGNLYIADPQFPGIYRVSPGGKKVDLWFEDPRVTGPPPSVAGVRVDPSGENLYFTIGSQPGSREGFVYRLPIDQPSSSNLREVFHYPANSLPGALAFGRSGKLYVALFALFGLSPTKQGNQISILRPDGTEAARFPSPDENARRTVPYDAPIAVAFDGKGSLLVANQAVFTQDPHHWAVLEAFVNDTEFPLVRPSLP